MLSYKTQLDLKRDVVVKAYRNFSGMIYTNLCLWNAHWF